MGLWIRAASLILSRRGVGILPYPRFFPLRRPVSVSPTRIRHVSEQQLLDYLTGPFDKEQEAAILECLRECPGCRETRRRFATRWAASYLVREGIRDEAEGQWNRRHCDVQQALDHLEGPYTETAGRLTAEHLRQCEDCRFVWVELLLLYPGASAMQFGPDLLALMERDEAKLDHRFQKYPN